MTRRWGAVAASALVYLAVTAILGRDVLAHLATSIASDEGDPLLTSAILYWNATRLPMSDAWWQFPIFHPVRDALTFSEHLLGLSVIATPLYWITRDTIVTYNLATLLTFPLCGLAMYALVFRLTQSAAGAFLAGLAFAFTPYRVSQLPHVQMLASFWAPLALLGLHAYLETGRRRWLLLYGATWMLQGAANGYALLFFSVLVGLWVLWFVVARGNWRALAMIAATTLVAAMPLAPIVLKYIHVHELHGFSRDLAEMRFFSADLGALFCAPSQLTFWGWLRRNCRPEGDLFPGGAVVALCVVAFIQVIARPVGTSTPVSRWLTLVSRGLVAIGLTYAAIVCIVMMNGPWRFELGPLRISASSIAKPTMVATATLLLGLVLSPGIRAAARGSSTLGFYLVAALATWALALGPTVTFLGEPRGIPAPFALLTDLPGFNGLRVPARFWLVAQMCLSVVVGLLGAALLDGRRRSVYAIGLVVASVALLTDGWLPRINAAPLPEPLPDERSLRDAVVLELPLGPLRDIAAQFRAVTGGWRTVNGYSGYVPSYYPALMDAVKAEDEAALVPFLALGDLQVVVADDAPRLKTLVEEQPGAVVVARNARSVQYRVPRRSAVMRVGELGARQPIGGVSASCAMTIAAHVMDGDESTRWECGPQRAGHELLVDLGRAVPVGAVVQNLANYTSNFPRHLVIETSTDGQSWQPGWDGSVRTLLIAQALERPSAALRIAVALAPRPARYVRLRLGATDTVFFWSVAEVEVWSGRPPGRDR